MLFITNKPPLTAMGDVLHDHDLAEAIVDRVLEPCVYQSTLGAGYSMAKTNSAKSRHQGGIINQPSRRQSGVQDQFRCRVYGGTSHVRRPHVGMSP